MDSPSPLETRTSKARRAASSVTPSGTAAAPTTFFLRKEKDLEKSAVRGRSSSKASSQMTSEGDQVTPHKSLGQDDDFGVESLENTIRTPFSSETSISRSTSQSSERSSGSTHTLDSDGRVLSRKRKAGNRVHPTILAAGRRIISSDYTASPASTPFTPIKSSATPSTPRSASPKSFRLSDEDSVADDRSQAVISSSGDEDGREVERTPQLVMPSLPMTARKPFTNQGKQLGRAKIMVVGRRQAGKTSFIGSLIRSTEHIVHVDQLRPAASQSSFNANTSDNRLTTLFTETQASTRPFPPFWTEIDHKRSRSNSIGSGILERNLTFIDTPGLDDDVDVERILAHIKQRLHRTADLNSLSDAELVGLLSGDGGIQIDAVFYLFSPIDEGMSPAHRELIRFLCKWTNLIPLISQADTITSDALQRRKQQVNAMFRDLQAEPYRLQADGGSTVSVEPLAVSSALRSDEDIIDASVLMSSQYLQPLVSSELEVVVDHFFDHSNFARLRHQSAIKFVLWKREHMATPQQMFPESPYLRSQSPGVTSTGSLLEEPSKVLVPHSSSSYYRSSSPAISDGYVPPGGMSTSNSALARHNEQEQPAEPLRQMRLAKWAQDLHRGLENERRKYRELYSHRPAEWRLDDEEKNEKQALVPATARSRPARGRLGGDVAVIDPLGVLAFGQAFGHRSLLAFQILGGCSLLGAAAYWMMGSWVAMQGYFTPDQPSGIVSAAAVSVRRHGTALVDDIRDILGWAK